MYMCMCVRVCMIVCVYMCVCGVCRYVCPLFVVPFAIELLGKTKGFNLPINKQLKKYVGYFQI